MTKLSWRYALVRHGDGSIELAEIYARPNGEISHVVTRPLFAVPPGASEAYIADMLRRALRDVKRHELIEAAEHRLIDAADASDLDEIMRAAGITKQ